VFKSHKKPVRKKALDICWTTKLHTPKPEVARITPITPDNTPAIRLTLVWVLKSICLERMVLWIKPKEFIMMTKDIARVRDVNIGWL
jgi:hypothetical protein